MDADLVGKVLRDDIWLGEIFGELHSGMVPNRHPAVKGYVAYWALARCRRTGDNPHMGSGKQPRIHFISEWRELRGLSREQLGEAVGMTRQNIQKIEQFDRPLMQDAIPRFAKALKVTAPQLFTRPDQSQHQATTQQLQSRQKINRVDRRAAESDVFPPGVTPVEEVDMRLGMGAGGLGEEINDYTPGGYVISKDAVLATWGVPEAYLQEIGIRGAGIFLFRAQGDSMERPDGGGLHSGDLVMADTTDKRPSPPGIFALWDGFGAVVKRVEYIMNTDPARLIISSDNPRHAPFERTLEEVNIIGRCVWYGRRL